jgi:hypothetical protein
MRHLEQFVAVHEITIALQQMEFRMACPILISSALLTSRQTKTCGNCELPSMPAMDCKIRVALDDAENDLKKLG